MDKINQSILNKFSHSTCSVRNYIGIGKKDSGSKIGGSYFARFLFSTVLISFLMSTSVFAHDYKVDNRVAELEKRLNNLCILLPGNVNCNGSLEAKCESDDGDKCECGEGKVCEATETSCACFKANDSSSVGQSLIDGFLSTRPPTPQYATIDVKCGSESYTLSTGNDSGNCQTTAPGSGGGGGGTCTDSSGNSAKVSCDTGCSSSSGAGSCTGP